MYTRVRAIAAGELAGRMRVMDSDLDWDRGCLADWRYE